MKHGDFTRALHRPCRRLLSPLLQQLTQRRGRRCGATHPLAPGGTSRAGEAIGEARLVREPPLQPQRAISRGRRCEAVDVHDGMSRAESNAPTDALRAEGGGPWQVEVHDHTGVLQIHAFGEQVRGEQQANGFVFGGRRSFLGERCESGESITAADATTGDLRMSAGEHADAGNIRECAVQGGNRLGELGEGDDRRAGMSLEQFPEGIDSRDVTVGGALMMMGESFERIEVCGEQFDERRGVHLMLCHQFREGELHFVITHEPSAELCLCGMSARAQRLQQGESAEPSLLYRVREGGITGAPGAKQSKPDQCAGDCAVVCWQGGG